MAIDSSCLYAQSGNISVFSYSSSLCSLTFKAIKTGIFQSSFVKSRSIDQGYDFSGLARSLDQYFSGQPVEFTEPLVYERDGFVGKALSSLRKVRFGYTVSYGRLAQMAGHPGACRAVGNVMAKNNLPLLIPCHRVILANGKIGNFGSGKGLKEKLLRLEGAL
jgi:O-6-methylguanine DNA methyltransferase